MTNYNLEDIKNDVFTYERYEVIDDLSIREDNSLKLSIFNENNNIIIVLDEISENGLLQGTHAISHERLKEINQEDFEKLVNEVYYYNMQEVEND